MKFSFSVIIPVYNVESYLYDCLNSLLNQSYNNYEVICINDGSTDGSPKILLEFQTKFLNYQIISHENKGLSAARNAGIEAAKGEYIFFLDSDDILEQNALGVLKEAINGEDLLCFNGRRIFEDGRIEEPDPGISGSNLSGWGYYTKYALCTRKFHFVTIVQRIYRREFLNKNKLLFKEGIYHEDNLFTPIACYYAQTVSIIPDCLYGYRVRPGSITQSYNPKRLDDLITVANTLSDFFIPIKEIGKKQIYKEIAGEYFGAFMPEKIKLFGKRDKELVKNINWKNFKKVSVSSRHARIYFFLSIHPSVFRVYLLLEQWLKNFSVPKK